MLKTKHSKHPIVVGLDLILQNSGWKIKETGRSSSM